MAGTNMDTNVDGQPQAHAQGRRPGGPRHLALVAAGVVAGVTLAGFGVASAQGGDLSARTEASAEDGPKAEGFRRFRGGAGRFHRGPGLGDMLHGEGVVRRADGTIETVAVQSGKVTGVGDGSVEVESTDGFTRTYTVTDDTKVLPRSNDIGDVDEGDEVRVVAVVDGDSTTVKRIVDVTDMPDRPHAPPEAGGTPEGAQPDAAA